MIRATALSTTAHHRGREVAGELGDPAGDVDLGLPGLRTVQVSGIR